ncbi:MAG: hypothetical protein JNL11_03970 [Bdellovibrionaceae bacterium]|nr:hypothetical protein [Pseudobdellovibrionaceae bacterium]
MRGTIFLILVVAAGFFQSANAKQFKNAYISFEIPERWNCILEATEWVCRSQDTNESKEAIIVLTAKEVGPSDSLQIYENHMKNAIKTSTKTGEVIMSQVMSPPTQKKINNLLWVDGFHLGSEVQNYYTRYIAAIKEKIAVLVTFSAHKDFYTKYAQDFFNAVNSLNVIATKNTMQDPSIQGSGGTLGPINTGQNQGIDIPGFEPIQQPQKKNNKFFFIVGAIVFAAVGLLLLLRMKKK